MITSMSDFTNISIEDVTLDDLKHALQFAVELELSTLPVYLSGMWSLKDQTGQVATLMSSVVREEMLHMGLACNLLTAIGGTPTITVPTYPGTLPGGVLPDLTVYLGGVSKDQVKKIYMEIEYPENGPFDNADKSLFPRGEQGPTIGQFYACILAAFQQLQPTIVATKQLTRHVGEFSVFSIGSLDDVERAIQEITEQGEGTSQSPDAVDYIDVLGHFYRFGEIWHEQGIVQRNGIWSYDGRNIPFPGTDEIYQVLPLQTSSYDNPPAKVQIALNNFNQAFSTLISQLQTAWANGDSGSLQDAIDTMFTLQNLATTIMGHPYSEGGVYGPEFLVVPPPQSGSGPSFKSDILILFRPKDINEMKPQGIDLSSYASVKSHAQAIYDKLSSRQMPCDQPWAESNIQIFKKWMDGGMNP